MQACYAVVDLGTSTREATTCNLLAVPAVTFNISPETKIKSFVMSSNVPLEDTALSLYMLYTSLPFVTVSVIVSALPLSSETKIEDTNVVIKDGHVYRVVTFVVVKSNLTFLYLDVLNTLAI